MRLDAVNSASRIIVSIVSVPISGSVQVSGLHVFAAHVNGSVSFGVSELDVIVTPGGTISVNVIFVAGIYDEIFSIVIW